MKRVREHTQLPLAIGFGVWRWVLEPNGSQAMTDYMCSVYHPTKASPTQLPTSMRMFVCRKQVSTREHFETVGKLGDGVVIGSAIIRVLQNASTCIMSA